MILIRLFPFHFSAERENEICNAEEENLSPLKSPKSKSAKKNSAESEKGNDLEKRYRLRECRVNLKNISSESECNSDDPETESRNSKPGPLSTKRFIQVRKQQDSPLPPPSVISRESRESISIDVVDEFVSDEVAACKTPDNVGGRPKFEDVEDETDNDDSSVEEVEILTTKSGRKVTKPKMQHFIFANKINKILDQDSEAEETEDSDQVLSKEKIEELKKTLPEKFQAGDLAWARLGVAPYWPCTITQDPDQSIHSNVSMRGKKAHREYHVQVKR